MSSDNALVLTEKHRRMLVQESKIDPAVIAERGYRSISEAQELATLGFSPSQRSVPGLLMPIWSVDGKVESHIYRPDSPRFNQKKKVIKYENPAGKGLHLDCQPRCRSQLSEPTIPLYITEGLKKCDSLVSQGVCVIGLSGGVWVT